MTKIRSYHIGQLHIEIHAHSSDFTQQPRIRVEALQPYKILGGGALVKWRGAGNLLTAMYPESDRVWVVKSQDHRIPSPATAIGYCICAKMRDGSSIPCGDYMIMKKVSVPAQQPFTEVALPDSWLLVGGGALAAWTGAGSFLYASHPGGKNNWIAAAKDHINPETSTVAAFAIGLKRSFLEQAGLKIVRECSTSSLVTAHPSVCCALHHGARLLSGGARTNWKGAGSLLTASYPQGFHIWGAQGKDHEISDPSTITAWCIGVGPK